MELILFNQGDYLRFNLIILPLDRRGNNSILVPIVGVRVIGVKYNPRSYCLKLTGQLQHLGAESTRTLKTHTIDGQIQIKLDQINKKLKETMQETK